MGSVVCSSQETPAPEAAASLWVPFAAALLVTTLDITSLRGVSLVGAPFSCAEFEHVASDSATTPQVKILKAERMGTRVVCLVGEAWASKSKKAQPVPGHH